MDIMTKNNLLGDDERSGHSCRDVSFERQTTGKIATDDGCGVDTKDSEIADKREKVNLKETKKKWGNGQNVIFFFIFLMFSDLMIIAAFFYCVYFFQ